MTGGGDGFAFVRHIMTKYKHTPTRRSAGIIQIAQG